MLGGRWAAQVSTEPLGGEMGIDAQVESEDGTVEAYLADPRGLVAKLLACDVGPSSACLRFIDPYGETVFNQLQLPVLIAELQQATALVSDAGARAHGEALVELARRAASEVHTYLRLTGD